MTTSVGIVQMQMCEDRTANLEAAEAGIRQAAYEGAAVVCLPELFASRYFCQVEKPDYFALAEPVPGPTTARFAALAFELNVVLILSLFERRARGLYHNTVAVIDGARGYVGRYRKMHIPDDPGYGEKFYFTPGDLGFRVFDTQAGRLGVLICWDQWYPEAARLTALQGADILLYPTAIGWHPCERETHGDVQLDAWETVQRSHAVANGCFVVAVNRTGFEPRPSAHGDPIEGIHFWGRSFAAGPDGRVLARLPPDQTAVEVVELDFSQIDELRHGWPFLRDRRIDAYKPLTRRFMDDE